MFVKDESIKYVKQKSTIEIDLWFTGFMFKKKIITI